MVESDLFKEETFKRFAENPCSQTAFNLIMASKNEIQKIAFNWSNSGLTSSEKIRELICEMFLVLLENFKVNIKLGYGSIVNYIRKRLIRVTHPRGKSFVDIDDEDIESIEDKGRINFDSEKMQQADILVSCIRNEMLACNNLETGLLYFLFIHVFPEVPWASKCLFAFYGGDKELRLANDKKRVYRFNANLRENLKHDKNFDIRGIAEWNRGERNYLAWRIIDIAPSEINSEINDDLTIVSNWRDNFNKNESYSKQKIESSKNVYLSMKSVWKSKNKANYVADEFQPYGKIPDLLDMLIGLPDEHTYILRENKSNLYNNTIIAEREYNLIAEELSVWFETLFNSRVSK